MYSEENLLNTLSLKYPHTNFPVDLHTFLLIKTLREFVKKSKRFPLGDHFINSHTPLFYCFGIVRGKLMLVTLIVSSSFLSSIRLYVVLDYLLWGNRRRSIIPYLSFY